MISLVLSAGLLACVTVLYAFRPDFAAAVTVFPAWIWLLPGALFLAAPLLSRKADRIWVASYVSTLLWLLYLLVIPEEPASIWRERWRTMDGGSTFAGKPIRVLSLNCAGGDAKAAAEAAKHSPDIVLLQEAPPDSKLRTLTYMLFGKGGSFAAALDPAIIVRGKITPVELPPTLRGSFVMAEAELASGNRVVLVSLRLTPALLRMDLWLPECWSAQAENRRLRREQLREMADRLASLPADTPVILGGDFNAPQGDAVYSLLRPRLRDAFAEGGMGWGNTITNELPLLRIDQIWISRHFRCEIAVAHKTTYSDHRMVVCDLTCE